VAPAPKGWQVPTIAQWEELIEFHGGIKSTEYSSHYYPNGGGVGPAIFEALGSNTSIAGLRLGEERKTAKQRITDDLLFVAIDEEGGYWAESGGLDQYDKTCPAEADNNCAAASVHGSGSFHLEICDDVFRTDAISLRLVKDE
jgi:hypothetical protein